jgi:glutamyl-tRNA synthetase
MSKRKSQTAMTAYREQGYLPEAMVNFLAFLGWSPGTEEEIFTLEELAARFEIGKVHRAGAIFDVERLDHLNGLYIRALTDEQLALRLRPFVPEALDDASLLRVVPLIKERIVRLGDATELLAFLTETDAEVTGRYAADELVPKKADAAATADALGRARAVLEALDPADFSADVIEARCRAAGEELGWKAGDFFRPLRLAVTGRAVTPPLFGSIELLGRDVTLARIDGALGKLQPVAGGR